MNLKQNASNYGPRILLGFLIFHLAVTCAYALQFSVDLGPWQKAKLELPLDQTVLKLYADYTGADKNFGFYAPRVGTNVRIWFEFTAGDEVVREPFGFTNANLEERIRLMGLVSAFSRTPQFHDFGSQSLAASAMSRHPSADKVDVVIQSYDSPSLEAYRNGERHSWSDIYRATFAYRGSKRGA